jgi:GST-like protein
MGAPRSTNGRTGNFVDEISARPAAAKALTLKDKLAWNSAIDEEAHANMCKHLKVAS